MLRNQKPFEAHDALCDKKWKEWYNIQKKFGELSLTNFFKLWTNIF